MNNDVKKIHHVINSGLYIQTITAVVGFSILYRKTDLLEKINKLLEEFKTSLTDTESIEFKTLIDTMDKEQAEKFVKELEKFLSPIQISSVLTELNANADA